MDKAKRELPTDLDTDPNVFQIDFASMPILNINLSGDYDVSVLESYAEIFKDKIERISEVAKVNIRGVDEKEVQILLNPYKMDAVKVSFRDVENAIGNENLNMSGGALLEGGLRRSLRVLGEFRTPEALKDLVVKSERGDIVHLGEIADVRFGYRKEKDSYARMNKKPVVSVDIVKRSGQNLLKATEKIYRSIDNIKARLPSDLAIQTTNDQSTHTRKMVNSCLLYTSDAADE